MADAEVNRRILIQLFFAFDLEIHSFLVFDAWILVWNDVRLVIFSVIQSDVINESYHLRNHTPELPFPSRSYFN